MKKLIALLSTSLVVVGVLGAPTTAAPKKQVVEGTILMRAPFVAGDINSCYSGLHRRSAVLTQEMVNGVVGFHFDLDPATYGNKFKLEVTGGQGEVDFDIIFYPEFGTPEQATDTGYAPPTVSFEERKPGGEKGVVPKEGFKKAIVCMWDGFDGSFTYTAVMG
ncbi:MAG: hypothetical protein M3277_04560 [Actinomycetota bacterium]|nr:hypothetical protein [Actinomycetota bacterium]